MPARMHATGASPLRTSWLSSATSSLSRPAQTPLFFRPVWHVHQQHLRRVVHGRLVRPVELPSAVPWLSLPVVVQTCQHHCLMYENRSSDACSDRASSHPQIDMCCTRPDTGPVPFFYSHEVVKRTQPRPSLFLPANPSLALSAAPPPRERTSVNGNAILLSGSRVLSTRRPPSVKRIVPGYHGDALPDATFPKLPQ
jgi:hypothetical protein